MKITFTHYCGRHEEYLMQNNKTFEYISPFHESYLGIVNQTISNHTHPIVRHFGKKLKTRIN
jgi:hypothetical protein